MDIMKDMKGMMEMMDAMKGIMQGMMDKMSSEIDKEKNPKDVKMDKEIKMKNDSSW